ncbi:adenine deaminase [Saccharicrinis aurantiacus]|uniref:adenine deaminase n=1 Tax=Saccharicrinis aurantiacus TaxID=1849719 RepID=UPI002492D43A|nr:adenine deaminase [Saccharicrinis aurantiacus]
MIYEGNIIDVINSRIFKGRIEVKDGLVFKVEECDTVSDHYILPGLVDSHVHIESSMSTPSQFSKLVVPRGTVAVVTDPHEIANVLGIEGVDYMIKDAEQTPLKCFFGAPSCVPATPFESSGAVLNSDDIQKLLERDDIWFLSEMMNFPGVINQDEEVLSKIKAAHRRGKKIDGHAPGIVGEGLRKYAQAGISSDHECVSTEEAIEKINRGITVQIREGSAAKNFDILADLFRTHPDEVMLCTDDSHPDEIINKGHIDKIIKKGITQGYDIMSLLRAATLKPIQHYNLPVGLLRKGDAADFIIIDNLTDFNILETYINGTCVYNNSLKFEVEKSTPINNFNISSLSERDIKIENQIGKKVRVIVPVDGDLLTDEYLWETNSEDEYLQPSVEDDILKIVVVNRYKSEKPIVGFIKNIGIKAGAFACSVAHDSHNLIAVGVDDQSIVEALNAIIEEKGGISVKDDSGVDILPLEVAGLMTASDGVEVARKYEQLNTKVQKLGSPLKAPFMTVSFMSLLVIPSLKIGDKGLFDVNRFSFTSLFV